MLDELATALQNASNRNTLATFLTHKLVPHELPIDYIDDAPEANERIHRPGNIQWIWGEASAKTIAFRAALAELRGSYPVNILNRNGTIDTVDTPMKTVMKYVLSNKIQVKTYLTDRAQTGSHQTNREKRWETHPNSVQYASRRNAWLIEYRLLNQIVHFDGFPEGVRNQLVEDGIIDHQDSVTRCPVTLDPLSFSAFVSEVMSPVHGRSGYQVGHLNPLKAVGRDNPEAGHTYLNISWISQDGNRIQGSLSLNETESLLNRIFRNRGWAG